MTSSRLTTGVSTQNKTCKISPIRKRMSKTHPNAHRIPRAIAHAAMMVPAMSRAAKSNIRTA